MKIILLTDTHIALWSTLWRLKFVDYIKIQIVPQSQDQSTNLFCALCEGTNAA